LNPSRDGDSTIALGSLLIAVITI